MTFSIDLESKYSLYGYLQTVRLIKSFFDIGVPISTFTFLNFHHGHPDAVTDVKSDIMLEGLKYLTGDELYYACADLDNEDLPHDIQIVLDDKKFNFGYETIFIENKEMKEKILRNEISWHLKAYKDFSYVVISLDHYELSDILDEFLGVWS
ncbi:hypothetical protein [Bacillus altitudinis]|uniref:hypothetical protein n=1 Tax=Bacillus altitudinis TaxID=293387 RepID=UPI001C22CEDE|nr:hypothetical protein [Bacillus altitudinis]MBU8855228.1 hypothetical protein [Bacillus sp. FJAT-26377]MCY7454336.1 hypothetical protein [Bacillus altitudinis]